jgi:protein-S-isoprenylcysteine O-methyltransferase Ste14
LYDFGVIKMKNKSGPFGLIIVSSVAFLAWLIFILFFALFWSNSYNIFQGIIIVIASLGIIAVLIGLMWFIWGRNQWSWQT